MGGVAIIRSNKGFHHGVWVFLNYFEIFFIWGGIVPYTKSRILHLNNFRTALAPIRKILFSTRNKRRRKRKKKENGGFMWKSDGKNRK